jgi:gas vesicle protein
MNKFFSFAAGALTGALAGAVLALLLTPASGEEIKTQAVARWETALKEARSAMEQTRAEMEAQFEQMKKG